jgi:hypothetical protein
MGKIKKAFVLLFVAGLLSPVTGGVTMLLYSLGVIYIIFGDPAIEAAMNLPILLVKLMLFPFTLVFGSFKKVTGIGKFFWLSGTENIHRKHFNERIREEAREEEDDDDEDDSALGYVKEGLSLAVAPFTKFKLRYGFVLLFFIWVLGYPEIFSTVMSDPTQVIQLDNVFMIFLLGLPFIFTIVFSSFMAQIFGNHKYFWKAGDSGIGEAAAGIAGTAGAATASAPSAGEAVSAAKEGAGDFKDIKGYGEKGAEGIEAGAEQAAARASSMAEGTALEGALEGTMFESVAASVGGAATGGVVLSFVLVVMAVIFYAGILAVVGSLVGALTWGWFNFMLPFFAKPILGALGLGAAYGQWFGESTANTVGPQVGGVLEEEIRMLKQGFAKVGCFAKGPQCIRQWRMNNTVRPGSDAEGESYELRIEHFGLGTDQIDKAYKEANYTLPVNFLVENTRHGLKGINARNVEYRINVESFDKTHCTTGWKSIDTFPNQPDKDYILPGLGVSPTDSEEFRNMTLGNCDLLQPSMGENRVMTLAVKYDYSSQATLYVDAMARQYRREQGIQPSFKKSRTARTPVQSYVNVQAPVTFFETQDGREAVPFSARFGFETPGYDVEYKVHPDSVDIRDSSRTTHTENNCQGLEHEGGDEYRVSDEAEQRIDLRQNKRWFNANVDPAPLRCTMEIEEDDLGLISPTGQQLIMRIDGNYTVKREQQMADFNVWNTQCTRRNCPMVVTRGYEGGSEYDLFSECSMGNSVDSRGGCSIRVPEPSGDKAGRIDWQMPRLAERNGEPIVLDQGETAYRWQYVENTIEDNYPSSEYREVGDSSLLDTDNAENDVIGLEKDEFENSIASGEGMAAYMLETGGGGAGDLQFSEVRYSVCEQAPNINTFVNTWKDYNGVEEIVDMRVNTVDCNELLREISTSADCSVDLASEVIQTGTGWNTFVEGGGLLGDTYTACDKIDDLMDECGAGKIRVIRDGRVSCYGTGS